MPDLDDFDYQLLRLQQDHADLPNDPLSRDVVHRIDFASAIKAADLGATHGKLEAISDDGVVDWSRFDITDFARLMPSLAILDRKTEGGDEVDFTYGYVGETINTIARRSLRGLRLRDVFRGKACDDVIREYCEVLDQRHPHASTGRVVISDMDWMHYLRLLYPVRHKGTVERILLIMLFAAFDADAAGQSWLPGKSRS